MSYFLKLSVGVLETVVVYCGLAWAIKLLHSHARNDLKKMCIFIKA